MLEDPSCTEVNRAYLKTRSYPNYSVDMPLIKSDGTRKPYKYFKFSEKGFLSKYAFQDQWQAFLRPPRKSLVGNLSSSSQVAS